MDRKRPWILAAALIPLAWWLWPDPPTALPTAAQTPDVPRGPTARPPASTPFPTLPSEPEGEDTEVPDEEEPDWTIRCPIPMDAPYEGDVDFTEYSPHPDGGVFARGVKARMSGGELLVEAEDPANTGNVRIPGYPDFDWTPSDEGGCPQVELQAASAIVGQVTPFWGRVKVHACGTIRSVELDGSFYVPASPGTCKVRAFRAETGGISADGETITVDVLEGRDTVVDLTVPEDEWGTLGLTLKKTDGVVSIRTLWEGSVADLAGVEEGDVLVSINGESPIGCDRGWLFNCFHGPLGSVVTLEFEDGEVLELERGRLPVEP